ncbi:MAG: group II intron reverse transcriptase/maturase [Gammaproteobacteria bacterium]|nr:group II intron reverse transcriptase/maturase [Gammaproteobacteria bacterium]
MTVLTGAPLTCADNWKSIDWPLVETQVKRLQMRIAKAVQENRFGKAKALQWVLTHSYFAKLLAVKRVTSSRGGKTAGSDGVIWKTDVQKLKAVTALKRKGYQAAPLRRVFIPKKNGRQRPLGIPTMADRAQQALYLLGLEPIAETTADKNSYGFRRHRSCADAIEQCFRALAKKSSAQWVLEGDIKSCFDKINHDWLLNHIPLDRKVLEQWLGSGFIYNKTWYDTPEGTPQGGVASPTLANMVLDGMELLVKSVTTKADKVNFVRYADDFIVTGCSKEVLEQKVKPALTVFLAERGLVLSSEKTSITHINEGFDFLGFNVRKYSGKLLIKPSKKSVSSFLQNISQVIKKYSSTTTVNLLRRLNPLIRGWANYYKHVVAKDIFCSLDHRIFRLIWNWCKRRHPNKNAGWLQRKYFLFAGVKNWIFYSTFHNSDGNKISFNLFEAGSIPIRRHVKIKAEANPFNYAYAEYFKKRKQRLKLYSYKLGADNFDGYFFER